jgi:Ca-activated chloride channel family protein
MSLFQFEAPKFFWLTAIIPLFILLFYWSERIKAKRIKKIGDAALFQKLMPEYSRYRQLIKYFILCAALLFLVFAMARPRYVTKIKTDETLNRELVIALDVSKSMLAQDVKPDRMQRAKQMISELFKNNRGSRIGLIIFAGEAFVQIPMTSSYADIDIFLSSISAGSIPMQGTNISEAIKLGEAMFDETLQSDKLILILSDGENHEQDAIETAKEAKEKGIIISTVGLGKNTATPIPDPETGEYKKDQNQKVVLTKLNDVLLTQIANAGGGNYYETGNLFSDVKRIQDQIDNLGKTEGQTEVEEYAELYPWFVAVALLLVMFEFFLYEKRNQKITNLSIFK